MFNETDSIRMYHDIQVVKVGSQNDVLPICVCLFALRWHFKELSNID